MAPKQRTPSKKSKNAEQKEDLMDVTPPACTKKLKVSAGTQIRIASKDSEDQMNKFYDAMECAGGSEGEEDDLNFSRNYFIAKETRGLGKKSGKKISDIDVVDEQELRAALSSLEPKHEKEQFALLDNYKVLYSKWLFQLRCGFGLLLYGFGSKRKLLEDFALSTLTDGGVVVINGYLPSVNLKNVISTIAEVLWSQLKSMKKSSTRSKAKAVPPLNLQSLDEILEFFNGSIESVKDAVVYVIVHNIDGPALRESDAQQCLAAIAACSRVRVVASIDHVNAPILWDKQMARAQFNWWWYHAPTYAAYTVEGTFLPLILASTGAVQNARTATIVLQSLTPNAQSVFKILAEYQLVHTDEQGLPIQRLYTLCREKFLVSSQVTLNSHLTEFKDHELVRTRRGADGQDCLYIPFPSEALSKILQDMNV